MTEDLRVIEPDIVDTEKMEQETRLVVQDAQAITITNDKEYEGAGTFLREQIKATLKGIDAIFGPLAKRWHDGHKATLAEANRQKAPLIEAEGIVKTSMATYHRQQEEEQRRLEAEQRRLATEQAEKEALERAAELENQGKTEEAEALIERPIAPVVVPAPAVQKPQAAGVSVRKVWKFRVVDPAKVNAQFMIPDEKQIGKVVRAMGADAGAMVGGIEVYAEEIVSARA